MCTAQTIVTIAAIATANYATGLVAVSAMALCGLVLVAAESASLRQGNRR
jgi:hypothetical protein